MKIVISMIIMLAVLPAEAVFFMPRKKLYKCHEKFGFNLEFRDFENKQGKKKHGQFVIQCPLSLTIDEDEYGFHGTILFEYKYFVTNPSSTLKEENLVQGELYSGKKVLHGIGYGESRLSIDGELGEDFEFACNYWLGNTTFQISFEFDYSSYDSNLDCSLPETIMDEFKKDALPKSKEVQSKKSSGGSVADFRSQDQ